MISARDFTYEAHRVPLQDKHGNPTGVAFVHLSAPSDVVPHKSGHVRGNVRSVLQLDKAGDGATRCVPLLVCGRCLCAAGGACSHAWSPTRHTHARAVGCVSLQ